MSLCRWSSDNFRCDLYCYESFGGFMTHVASSRIVGELPMDPLIALVRKDELGLTDDRVNDAFKAHRTALEKAERVPIGLPHDGKSFADGSPEDWRDRIAGLKALGYHVPDGVLEEVEEMIAEAATAA